MPRGRKKAEVPSSPKSTRSSRAKKKVEIPINYEAQNLSNDHPEKMSSKRQTSTRGRQEIDELKERKEEESNQSKDVGKTRKPRKVGSVQIEEKVPDETSVKGRKVLDTKVSPIKKNPKKRKLSAEIIEAALTDSSKKATVSPVKKKTTVAIMSENPDLLEMIFGYLDPTSVKIASLVSR